MDLSRYLHVCVCVFTFSVQKRFSRDFLAALCVSVAIVFKNSYFPCVNMLISPIVMRSHLVAPSPKPLSNLFLPLFLSLKREKQEEWVKFFPPGCFPCHLVECVAIFALPGD